MVEIQRALAELAEIMLGQIREFLEAPFYPHSAPFEVQNLQSRAQRRLALLRDFETEWFLDRMPVHDEELAWTTLVFTNSSGYTDFIEHFTACEGCGAMIHDAEGYCHDCEYVDHFSAHEYAGHPTGSEVEDIAF